ncbi:hypothetical protein AB0J43_02055 [Nonomuraea fuscirosea]
MASITTDGSIEPHPRMLDVAGSSLRGTFLATYNQLREAFGEEDTPGESHPEWTILMEMNPDEAPNQRASIYPSAGVGDIRLLPNKVMPWHVGGYCDSFKQDGRRTTLAERISSTLARPPQ